MEKVRYVQRIHRQNGRVDLYFRKGANREGPLESADGSAELAEEVAGILKRLEAEGRPHRPKGGTVGKMLTEYAGLDADVARARGEPAGRAEFLLLARSTQESYDRFAREIREDFGHIPLAEVDRSWLLETRDIWATRGYKAANDRMQILKNALAPAILDERIKNDPFSKIEKLDRPHDLGEPNLAWEDAEVAAAIDLALARETPGLARVFGLGRWGGFRRGTICALPPNARVTGFDENGLPHRRLLWMTEKRKVLCDKPEDSRLTALLASTPNRAMTIAYNADAQPWKPRQLNQAVTRLVDALVKKGLARPGLTLHGLRHARGVELAMAGASDGEIMAQIEHATDRAAKIYRRQAERRRLADHGQAKIDRVIDLRAAAAARKLKAEAV